MNQVIQTPAQHYYLSKLLGYAYTIVYKPGKSNTIADALSRRDTSPDSQYLLLTSPTFDFFNILLLENKTLPDLKALHSDFSKDKSSHPHFSIHNGILYFKGKPYLRKDSTLIPLFLQEFHATPTDGHAGVTKTLYRLKENVYWDSMHKQVKNFVLHVLRVNKPNTHLNNHWVSFNPYLLRLVLGGYCNGFYRQSSYLSRPFSYFSGY